MSLDRGARIEFDKRSRLLIGFPRVGQSPCWVSLRANARFSVQGEVILMNGTRVVVAEGAHLEVGGGTYIHCDSTVTCFGHIRIGTDCAISWNTNILDGNGHDLTVDGMVKPWPNPVEIGNNVWVGTGAIVLPGVRVEDGAVVGGERGHPPCARSHGRCRQPRQDHRKRRRLGEVTIEPRLGPALPERCVTGHPLAETPMSRGQVVASPPGPRGVSFERPGHGSPTTRQWRGGLRCPCPWRRTGRPSPRASS